MQEFITSTEANALLDRILQTVQSLNQTRAFLFGKEPEMAASPAVPQGPSTSLMVHQTPPVLSVVQDPVVPVLTIKLADLIRAGSEARERRNQHFHPQRPNKKRPQGRQSPPQGLRMVEVVYRKTHRMAS